MIPKGSQTLAGGRAQRKPPVVVRGPFDPGGIAERFVRTLAAGIPLGCVSDRQWRPVVVAAL